MSDRPWTGPGKRLFQRKEFASRASICFHESERRKASDEGLRQTEEQKQVRVTLLLNSQMAKEAPDLL